MSTMQTADAIITADWHLRESSPRCRTDNYLDAQASKLKFLSNLQKKHKCPIIDAGDMFDRYNNSIFFLSWVMKNIPNRVLTIPGNHDLPNHNMRDYLKASMCILELGNKIKLIPDGEMVIGNRRLLIVHTFLWHNNKPEWIKDNKGSAISFAKEHKQYDLVVVGDNHDPFICEYKKTKILSPGSMLRSNINQKDHKPRCYLYYAENNILNPVYFPIEEDVISDSHIREITKTSRYNNEKADAFFNLISEELDMDITDFSYEVFISVLRKSNQKIGAEVKQIVREAFDGKVED